MISPEFMFDFGSPNAYLAHRVIPQVERRTGARFTYVPVLLGGVFKATDNQSPMQAFAGVPAKLAYERLEMERFIARHGLADFRMNPHFPVNTLAIMRGAVAADELGLMAPYVEAMFVAMWERGLPMSDPATIGEALNAAELPAGRLMALAQEQAMKDRLVANTSGAVARGVFGAPTFFVGDQMFFGKDRLGEIEVALTVI